MTRREFLTGSALAGLNLRPAPGANPFPVRFAQPNPYDSVLRFIEPGSDQFKSEKEAFELEARLARIFAGAEPAPDSLKSWVSSRSQIIASRFFALPDSRVRFEIKTATGYETGVWRTPGFDLISSSKVSASQPFFRDVTAHLFEGASSFREQMLFGNPYWRARLDSACGIDVYGNQGISVADVDGDGVDEIYVCQPGGLPNRLYKIRPNGTAEDITERSRLGILDETTCALFADFRNAGVQDVVILRSSGPLYFANDGHGNFQELRDVFRFKKTPQGSFTGMAAADFDRDGRLDLYLCCYIYFQSEDQYQYPAPYQDARNGPPNFLFRNLASPTGVRFDDVSAESGMDENNDRFSFAPAWCDFDGSGWPSLFVANDFGRPNLYRNREGKFRDEARSAGLDGAGPGMSAAWFDYDGDGRPDLYVADMWTAPGQRVVRDPQFVPGPNDPEAFRRHTKGNSLYRNKGDGTFEETGAREQVEVGRWAWSSGGFDWDLDGVPEILIAAGMITNGAGPDLQSFFWRQVVAQTPESQRAAIGYENGWNALNQLIREDYNWNGHEPNVFYKRGSSGPFLDCSGVSGLDFADDTRTFVLIDFDQDGVPDLILKNRLAPQIRAMRNESAANRASLAISLRGVKSNRDAIGARVEVNGQVQFATAGSGFLSQHSKILYFGLKGVPAANVNVLWPGGLAQSFTNLSPGFTYTLTEGSVAFDSAAFRPRAQIASKTLAVNNTPAPADTWLLEPVPAPDFRTPNKKPLFLILYSGAKPNVSSELPIQCLELTSPDDPVAATYSLFRRYLFEYRTNLSLPLTLLLDEQSRACRIYSSIPSEGQMRADLHQLSQGERPALPFPGTYYLFPRRNYFKLGAAFYWAGYPEQAIPYLNETLRTNPGNWKAQLAIARIQLELKQYPAALASFQSVIAIRKDYPAAWLGAGEALARQGSSREARSMFERALQLDPKYADAMNQMGLLFAQVNDFAPAKQWFERAIEQQSGHPGASNNLAVLFAKTGKPNDSIAAFRYGIENNPDDEELYLNLSRVYLALSDRERARGVLNELLERKPASRDTRKALEELEAK